MFQELIQLFLQDEFVDFLREFFFTWDGLRPQGAVVVALLAAVLVAFWDTNEDRLRRQFRTLPSGRQKWLQRGGMTILVVLVLIIFPLVAGNFIGQVLLTIALFILMGMGLNLEIGLAGLLDMGFVAFFAVGAYVCALLTADSPYAIAQYVEWFPVFNWWTSLVFSVVCALMVGILLGIPVLKIRGDYLAVATLATGEITRILVLSDFAAPVLAGPQGIHNIPSPTLFTGILIDDPIELYFVTLSAAGLAAWIAHRLENSRLGRAWTAIRDDEDVAQALGVNLLNVKLLAYGLGAAFAGLAGAIFATMLKSIYPHSFQLLISINVLALIIVGGMGSLPGVVLGALVLIGLPELMREFGDYRYFFYGLAIIVVMRLRPEGLWPSKARRRERRLDRESEAAIKTELGKEGGGVE
jgi:branched-chain amino acid transport system permease protein